MFATFTLPPVLASVPELANVQRHTKLVRTLGLDSPRRTPSSQKVVTAWTSKVPQMILRKRGRSATFHSSVFRSSHSTALAASPNASSKPLPLRPSKIFQAPGFEKFLMTQKRAMQRRNTLPSLTSSIDHSLYPPQRRAS